MAEPSIFDEPKITNILDVPKLNSPISGVQVSGIFRIHKLQILICINVSNFDFNPIMFVEYSHIRIFKVYEDFNDN